MLGTPKIDATHAILKEIITDNMKTRSVAEITLRRSNERGGHYFVSLKTVSRLHSYQWQELPITNAVINRLEEISTAEEPT